MTGILILRTNTSRLVLIVAIPDSNIQLFCEHFNGTIPVKLYLSSWCRKWRFGEFHFKNCPPSRKSSFRERSPLVSLLKPYFKILLRWPCCWKSFAGKRSVACVAAGPRTRLNPLYSPYTEGLERLRRRLKKRGGRARASRKVAPFHAVPSRVPRASPISLKGHGNDCHTGRPALYVVLFLSLYLPFRFNCTPFSLSNMWYF